METTQDDVMVSLIVLGALALLIGFISQMERVVSWLMSGKPQPERETFKLRYIEANLMQTPEIAVLQAQKETVHLAQRVQQMFGMVRQAMSEEDASDFRHLFCQIAHQEDLTDRMELEIGRYLEQVSTNHLSYRTKAKVRQMLREVGELESVGDACYHLARTLRRQREAGEDFIVGQFLGLNSLMTLCDDALTQMVTVMTSHRHEYNICDTFRIENEINQMRQQLKTDNIRAVNDRDYDYAAGTIFNDMVNTCEKLGDYVVNVVQARFGR